MDNINVVLDVSSIIWNEEDYNNDTYGYYGLAESILLLFDKLEKEKPKVLISVNLLDEMLASFPYGKISPYNYFEKQAMEFLNKIDVTEYAYFSIPDIVSYPNLIKTYFNSTTKDEIIYLISNMHLNNVSEAIYFTFRYLWIENDKLRTEIGENQKEYQTIISDRGTELDDFFEKFKPKFDHNPKHDKKPNNTREKWEVFADKNAFDSRLSCYNGIDNIEPQKILDKAIKYNSEYIGYDEENEVWVRFYCHKDNLYHGFDEYDDKNTNKIPLAIKVKFHK